MILTLVAFEPSGSVPLLWIDHCFPECVHVPFGIATVGIEHPGTNLLVTGSQTNDLHSRFIDLIANREGEGTSDEVLFLVHSQSVEFQHWVADRRRATIPIIHSSSLRCS